jgi:hypothetical protein
MTNARQAGEVANRYQALQGLKQVAAGVGLLAFFAYELVAPLNQGDIRAMGIVATLWGLAAVVLGFVVMLVAIYWISAWYRRNYGLVEQTTRQRREVRVIGAAGAVAFLIAFNADTIATNSGHALPVNLMDFAMALWIVGYWWYLGRSFRHYLVLAGIGFVLGVASIAGIPPATFAWHLREATLYFAVASIAGGLIDHRILSRALQTPEEPIVVQS